MYILKFRGELSEKGLKGLISEDIDRHTTAGSIKTILAKYNLSLFAVIEHNTPIPQKRVMYDSKEKTGTIVIIGPSMSKIYATFGAGTRITVAQWISRPIGYPAFEYCGVAQELWHRIPATGEILPLREYTGKPKNPIVFIGKDKSKENLIRVESDE